MSRLFKIIYFLASLLSRMGTTRVLFLCNIWNAPLFSNICVQVFFLLIPVQHYLNFSPIIITNNSVIIISGAPLTLIRRGEGGGNSRDIFLHTNPLVHMGWVTCYSLKDIILRSSLFIFPKNLLYAIYGIFLDTNFVGRTDLTIADILSLIRGFA